MNGEYKGTFIDRLFKNLRGCIWCFVRIERFEVKDSVSGSRSERWIYIWKIAIFLLRH